jgi:putative NADH-flavin reductase
MPLIVVGADTDAGEAILSRLDGTDREIRAFVTDESTGLSLKGRGFKVATGDVSDDSHVEAAALRCFSAVLIAAAASDDRERAFAETPEEVLAGWERAVSNSGVTRVIWVTDDEPPETRVSEVAVVDPADPGLASAVLELDEAASLS